MTNKLFSHWEKVNKRWRHFPEEMDSNHKLKHLSRIEKHLIEQLPKKQIKTAIDWGCGGGFKAKIMKEHLETIYLVDVSKSSLDEAIKQTGENKENAFLAPEKLFEWDFPVKQNIDLLFCYNVIYHFPSLSYFEDVINIWKQIKPNFIAGSSYFGKQIKEKKESYFQGQNFLRGLILTKEKFLKTLKPDYKLIYWANDKWNKQEKFFILERIEND